MSPSKNLSIFYPVLSPLLLAICLNASDHIPNKTSDVSGGDNSQNIYYSIDNPTPSQPSNDSVNQISNSMDNLEIILRKEQDQLKNDVFVLKKIIHINNLLKYNLSCISELQNNYQAEVPVISSLNNKLLNEPNRTKRINLLIQKKIYLKNLKRVILYINDLSDIRDTLNDKSKMRDTLNKKIDLYYTQLNKIYPSEKTSSHASSLQQNDSSKASRISPSPNSNSSKEEADDDIDIIEGNDMTCSYCEKTFNSLHKISKHETEEHLMFTCKDCGNNYKYDRVSPYTKFSSYLPIGDISCGCQPKQKFKNLG